MAGTGFCRWLGGFRGRFRDDDRESFPAGTGRRGGDGEIHGDGEAGPGGRDRGPAGGGAGGGAGRPGGAVARAWRPGRRRRPGTSITRTGRRRSGTRAGSCSGCCCRPRSTSTPPARSGPPGSPAPPGSATAASRGATAGAWPACSGPSRVTRMAYRNRREPSLYPADVRQVLPGDPYSLGMRTLAAFHLAGGGSGGPRRSSRPAPASPSAAPRARHRGRPRRLDGRLLRRREPGTPSLTCRTAT